MAACACIGHRELQSLEGHGRTKKRISGPVLKFVFEPAIPESSPNIYKVQQIRSGRCECKLYKIDMINGRELKSVLNTCILTSSPVLLYYTECTD